MFCLAGGKNNYSRTRSGQWGFCSSILVFGCKKNPLHFAFYGSSCCCIEEKYLPLSPFCCVVGSSCPDSIFFRLSCPKPQDPGSSLHTESLHGAWALFFCLQIGNVAVESQKRKKNENSLNLNMAHSQPSLCGLSAELEPCMNRVDSRLRSWT